MQNRQDFGKDGMRADPLGLLTPIGGSSVKKEFIRIPIPKELASLAGGANMLPRGKLSREVGSLLALLNIIAPTDLGTKVFTAMIVGASMSEDGQAMTNLLMSDTSMLVPQAMSTTRGFSPDGHSKKIKDKNNGKPSDDE
jgi:hypothetical protein